jgi:hypothetical protein
MHDYQDRMGKIQDLEVLQRTLGNGLEKASKVAPSLQSFRQELARRHAALVAHYLARADQLLEFWPAPGAKSTGRWDGSLIERSPVADGPPPQSLEEGIL